ncbi:triple tyrosine motif-containing protein [Fulvivirga sp. M361]|uniref:ligand-binding sensor domain-containing protein n=1 Tax=Fulvivirga sp. M361 TaxID=2594266 RepID=UPI00162AE0C8|nr:triple tyrosine motif-containing protein [Fulvivirga sp. M361]
MTKTFQTNDYEGGIQNWDIAQDKKGYIYVANNFGLLEYDGNNWKKYLIENNTRVRSVFVDSDNRIYIGGQNQFGYFESDEKGVLVFHSLYDQMQPKDQNMEDVWKIVKYQDKLLFSSYQGLVTYDGKKVSKIDGAFDYDLVFEVANRLFVYSPTTGMASWTGETFSPVIGSDFLTNQPVTAIIPYQNNSLLIFQKNGKIFQYKQDVFTEWESGISDFLAKAQVNTAIVLDNHNIAIGTQNNGLAIVSPEGKVVQYLTKGKGLNNRTVLSLHEDSFKNLWVGLHDGITMVELSSPFSLIGEQSGLPGTGYCATTFNNKLYLGTNNGLFYQEANSNPLASGSSYKLVRNTSGQVYNIQQINEELFLAHHNGAFLVTGDNATRFYNETGTWKFAHSVGKNRILAGAYDGFRIFEKKEGTYFLYRNFDSFKESSRVFEFTNDSTLFMTHGYKGAYKITFNQDFTRLNDVRFYGQNDGFPSHLLINVFDLGSQLVFAAERGIYIYDDLQDRFLNYQNLEKHLSAESHVTELTSDLKGNIFFRSDQALGYLEKTPFGEYEKNTAIFKRISKYLSDDFENISIIDHQNVFFGAKEGFIHYNPSIEYPDNQPFETYIREITVIADQEELLYGGSNDIGQGNIFLPAFFSSLKFRFASPYFHGQDELVFQYLLENFEKDWSEWSALTEKEYTNLYEGEYTFRVRARNTFNQISQEASFSFKVYPPWYRSKLAYFLYAGAVVLIFGTSMFLLDTKHRKKRKQLTIEQQRELMRKENEIEEVSKKSKEEITRLKNEKLRAEVDHKNRELATNTMHLINKNEFMISIKKSLQMMPKESADSKNTLKKIIRDIDRNLSEDDGWHQFTKHFDQIHGSFLKNIKAEHPMLTPQEVKLCAYLKMNMSSKEIANLLNISVRGVEISRYRLRKKLGLSRETNLVNYMLEYS